jgi:hypothetical protein
MLKSLEVIGKRLDSQKVNIDENMLKLTKFQEEVLLRAMDSALNFAKKQLAEQYPEIPIFTLDELVADGLTRAKYEILDD